MVFYIYILQSKKFDKFYIGFTSDYNERLLQHNTQDKNTFTAKYRPWVLKAVFYVGQDRGKAMMMEKYIKKQKSKTLLKKLIDPDFVPLGRLATLVRVPHVRD